MSKVTTLFHLIYHFRVVIVLVVGFIAVVFMGDFSYMQKLKMDEEISLLKSEIKRYNTLNEHNKRQLREMNSDPKAVERIAREQYFMKYDHEDVFVLSDDNHKQ